MEMTAEEITTHSDDIVRVLATAIDVHNMSTMDVERLMGTSISTMLSLYMHTTTMANDPEFRKEWIDEFLAKVKVLTGVRFDLFEEESECTCKHN